MYTIADLLDLSHTMAAPLFAGKTYPYEVLDGIKGFILFLGETLSPEEYDHPKADVWIAKDAVIYPNNYIAHDMMHQDSAYVSQYTDSEKNAFEQYLQTISQAPDVSEEKMRENLLKIYATPVDNYYKTISQEN